MTCSSVGQSGSSSASKRRQARGHGERAILGFVDHGRQMGDGEARIERVANEPRAHGRVIHLQMMLRVPRERADAIAEMRSPSAASAPDRRLLRVLSPA